MTPAREARGARRRKRGAGAGRGRGDARRRPRPGAGVAGMGSVEASAGFSRRRRSVQGAKNSGTRRSANRRMPRSRDSSWARGARCCDRVLIRSGGGTRNARERSVGGDARLHYDPSRLPRPPRALPPPKPPSSRRARPRRLHRQSVFFLPPSALRLASFRSIACAASTRPTGTSSTDINTYGLFSSVRRPSSASRSGARTSLVACARKRGRSAGSRQFTRPGGRRRLRPRTPRDPKGGGSRIARRRTSYSRSNSFSNIPRDARVRRDGPPDARRGTRAVECDPRSESRDDGRDA